MTPDLIYPAAGAGLIGLALWRLATCGDTLRRIMALNVLAVGIAMLMLAAGRETLMLAAGRETSTLAAGRDTLTRAAGQDTPQTAGAGFLQAAADPVPQAFVLTGIVVLVAVTAALMALAERLGARDGD
ncbi:NADH-quinone oxidoreductase subunit K [Pseudoponticoccus marisrubri]|uniref:Uncharacterized protein n=1 Tax=Pseudoponticoccus marisrubri TaxID=1685382 RepID=A0A0W7WDU2_9RHOB|nr:NADH-quinone oxidoreductase subunit K [Pseudoponticoccus marisrubri]KUF08746.1 hypothetical protein AVJ23_21095 [Pseudoponticoccus marisrubri]